MKHKQETPQDAIQRFFARGGIIKRQVDQPLPEDDERLLASHDAWLELGSMELA